MQKKDVDLIFDAIDELAQKAAKILPRPCDVESGKKGIDNTLSSVV